MLLQNKAFWQVASKDIWHLDLLNTSVVHAQPCMKDRLSIGSHLLTLLWVWGRGDGAQFSQSATCSYTAPTRSTHLAQPGKEGSQVSCRNRRWVWSSMCDQKSQHSADCSHSFPSADTLPAEITDAPEKNTKSSLKQSKVCIGNSWAILMRNPSDWRPVA